MKFNLFNLLMTVVIILSINVILADVGVSDTVQSFIAFFIGFFSKQLGLPILETTNDKK